MQELTMRWHAGEAFLNSRYNHGHSDPEKREVYKRCFFKGFIAGVKFYAGHLFNKGSIFDIVRSIRETSEWERWEPLVDFEKTVLKALDFYGKRNELKQKTSEWKQQMTERMNENIHQVRSEYEQRLRLQRELLTDIPKENTYEASLEDRVKELEKENKILDKEVKAKDEQIEELSNILASLTRQGYK